MVLILVLVEHTLGELSLVSMVNVPLSLNPCFSGTYSRRFQNENKAKIYRSLNPCFSGTYSRRPSRQCSTLHLRCLNPCFSGTYSRRIKHYARQEDNVLILVLVEHTLGGTAYESVGVARVGLNPCFSGTYSRRQSALVPTICVIRLNPCFSGTYSRRLNTMLDKKTIAAVLILVLVEHTLGV